MIIAFDYPPNYQEIIKKFPSVAHTSTVVFTYGDTLYVPGRATIPGHLQAHEEVHTRQQALHGGPEQWWEKYLADPVFRFEQELQAYQKQWAHINQTEGRQAKRNHLASLARNLAGPIYGSIVSKRLAKDMITQ